MKRLFAFTLSLLLLWVQVFVLVQPAGADAPAACRCCECEQTDCCVAEAPSLPHPLAAMPVSSLSFITHWLALPASFVWNLPREAAPVSSDFVSLNAARIPLFTRDCALLI